MRLTERGTDPLHAAQGGEGRELAQSELRGKAPSGEETVPRRRRASHTAEKSGRHGVGGGRRRGAAKAERRQRKRRMLRWSATVLGVVILGTAGAGYLYIQHLNGNIRKGQLVSGDSGVEKPKPNADGQTPINILLLGSDSRNSDEDIKLGGARQNKGDPPRADVQMLIHVAADRKSAAFVSVPRDTRVDIPQCTDPKTGQVYPATNALINSSLARGGPGCTVATWRNLTKVYIDHWMMIDFSGVVNMADAIGGVDVCVQDNVWDHRLPGGIPGGSGLKLKAGKNNLQHQQALQWLRTRDAWGSDPMRAKAQHMYLNSMIRTLKKQNVFTDSGRFMDLAEAATKSLQVSEELGSVKKLYDLGMQLKAVPPNRITSMTMPRIADPQAPNSHLLPDPVNAEKVWEMLRDDVPFDKNGKPEKEKKAPAAKTPSQPAGQLGVLVQNATGDSTNAPVPLRAKAVADVLAQQGYSRAEPDTSSTGLSEDQTVVRYPSADLQGDAQAVAKALGIPASSVKKSTGVSGVTVTVGSDWRTGSSYPKQTKPKAGDVPSNSDAINGADESQCMPVYKPYRW
ncbi:LCP family protein [Streptomyces sp. NBC_00820]|uniref:LCP family protein n=1 Tax=Streptomyces sp. NBC_00820 TaxID=2975842 RepID=UPI002ED1652C|nr:LCP family protein [Streptomyces sp. NBC_00820]